MTAARRFPPPQWHDRWWGAAIFVAGWLPLAAAYGITRHVRYAAIADRQARYVARFREDPPT